MNATNNNISEFDVCIIGGGHAGVEAAYAASKLCNKIALISLNLKQIGAMSCNPAIGGLGKGHLVKEIDSLCGIMGRAADATGIQFRRLNMRKGHAVRGTRCQSDKIKYKEYIQKILMNIENLKIIEGEATDFTIKKGLILEVIINKNQSVKAKAFVLCAGTFLGAKMFIGDKVIKGGRIGEKSADHLSSFFTENGIHPTRFKTGTPPRLNRDSIKWDKLEIQKGDSPSPQFSVLSKPNINKIDCHITWTNENTHKIIKNNIHKSSLFLGKIVGLGPRYCPSIEDKIKRFSDKPKHQVFLEPESIDGDRIYVNGLSTCLPENIQESYIQSIEGLEKAEILQYGYAVEYDYLSPFKHLNGYLQCSVLKNLFCAGQINGTSGYEEAAAQGLVAGINSSRLVGNKELYRFSRFDSYIGVLIDDLVSQDYGEPYRMFTSRSENRMELREDNAFDRLYSICQKIGLNEKEYDLFYEEYCEQKQQVINIMDDIRAIDGSPWRRYFTRPELNEKHFLKYFIGKNINKKAIDQVYIKNKYQGYIEKSKKHWDKIKKAEMLKIPEGFFDRKLAGVSLESLEILKKVKPTRLHQLFYLPGITPGCISAIHAQIEIYKKTSS